MDTAAWRAASGPAIKVLLALIARDNGSRNGQISFSCREASAASGLSVRTCQRCFNELVELGFIRCTQKGGFSRKTSHASLWRYTWQAWPEGKLGPTREFEKWEPNGNTRMQVLHEPDANLSDQLKTHPCADASFATDEIGNTVVSANSASDRFATHTIYQSEPSDDLETEQWKQANPDTRAILGALRHSLIEHIESSETGEQSRLAKCLGIPSGTLSKFKNGGSLPEEWRIPLSEAVMVY